MQIKRKQPIKRIILFFLLTGFILFVLFPAAFLLIALEDHPAVLNVRRVNSDRAVGTRLFVKRVIEDLRTESHKPLTLSATEDDLNGLFAFGHRSISRISGEASISARGLQTRATLRIPHNPFGDYLNFHLKIIPSTLGLHFDQASMGGLSFSNGTMRFFTILFLNMAVGFNEGKTLYESIEEVTLSEDRINFHLSPIPDMDRHVLKIRERLSLLRDEVALMGDPKKVRSYYTQIVKIAERVPEGRPVSLSYYIGALFKIADARGGDPVVENRAAILALGIYFGSWRVEQMIGPVRTEEMKQQKRKTKDVGLAGREDLRLHFIISAALEIASKQGITHAIGEFKELLDAGDGGSGFSFVDLAADRAGVRFSEFATSPSTAKRFQEHLAENANEDQFFPNIENLPEGLTKEDFQNDFGDVESSRYVKLVKAVDACLMRLPAYRQNTVGLGPDPDICQIDDTAPEDL